MGLDQILHSLRQSHPPDSTRDFPDNHLWQVGSEQKGPLAISLAGSDVTLDVSHRRPSHSIHLVNGDLTLNSGNKSDAKRPNVAFHWK